MPELTAKLHDELKQWLKSNVTSCYWPQLVPEVADKEEDGPLPFADLR